MPKLKGKKISALYAGVGVFQLETSGEFFTFSLSSPYGMFISYSQAAPLLKKLSFVKNYVVEECLVVFPDKRIELILGRGKLIKNNIKITIQFTGRVNLVEITKGDDLIFTTNAKYRLKPPSENISKLISKKLINKNEVVKKLEATFNSTKRIIPIDEFEKLWHKVSPSSQSFLFVKLDNELKVDYYPAFFKINLDASITIPYKNTETCSYICWLYQKKKNILNQMRKHILKNIETLKKRIAEIKKAIEHTRQTENFINLLAALVFPNLQKIAHSPKEIISELLNSSSKELGISIPKKLLEKIAKKFEGKAPSQISTTTQQLIKNAANANKKLQALQKMLEENQTKFSQLENKLSNLNLKSIQFFFSETPESNRIPKRTSSFKRKRQFNTIELSNCFIHFGKNAEQNKRVMQFAKKNWLWFHVRDAAGSHVVLQPKTSLSNVTEEEILIAASIAAKFSKRSGKVKVDMATVKNVRAASGYKALYIYDAERTLTVSEDLAEKVL